MEPAVFRPVHRGQAKSILVGAAAGLALGLVTGIPPLLATLFGAVAAAIATSARHVAGVRLAASPERLEVLGRQAPFGARWEELRLGFGLTARPDGGDYQRYAVLADPQGRSVAFGAFGGQGPCLPVRGAGGLEVEVLDLEGAAVLLAILVQRVPAWQVLPSWLVELETPPPLEPTPAATSPASTAAANPERSAAGAASSGTPPHRPASSRVGLLALVAKLGSKVLGAAGKVGAGALKAAKGTNLAMAAASAAAYSILFSWKFAVLLLLQLFVHEYGHVHAMKKTGMRVRGMYFVPFLGALAVTDDAFTSRRQQAYVALNGPLWGGLFTLLPLGAYLLSGDGFWAAVAAWWAIINLFNLLPITPLDGGRLLSAFASSFSSNLGVAVGVLGLAGAVALGTVMGFSLIWLVAALGAMELVAESRARGGGRALRLLPEPARFGPAHYQYLRAVLGPPTGQVDELAFARDLTRMEQAARVEPMGRLEILRWGLLYAALAAGLLALVYFTSHLPGAAEAAQILT
jgi:Zn-dependent protease